MPVSDSDLLKKRVRNYDEIHDEDEDVAEERGSVEAYMTRKDESRVVAVENLRKVFETKVKEGKKENKAFDWKTMCSDDQNGVYLAHVS